jgi:hypothetical protein
MPGRMSKESNAQLFCQHRQSLAKLFVSPGSCLRRRQFATRRWNAFFLLRLYRHKNLQELLTVIVSHMKSGKQEYSGLTYGRCPLIAFVADPKRLNTHNNRLYLPLVSKLYDSRVIYFSIYYSH